MTARTLARALLQAAVFILIAASSALVVLLCWTYLRTPQLVSQFKQANAATTRSEPVRQESS
jgi:hypothetical protein